MLNTMLYSKDRVRICLRRLPMQKESLVKRSLQGVVCSFCNSSPSRLTRRRVLGITLLTMMVFTISSSFLMGTATATVGINSELSFEGKVVTSSGQNISDGTYNMEFRIYSGCSNEPTSNTGCTQTWTEDWLDTGTNTGGVALTSGTFQVNLGSLCPFTGVTCTPSGANGGATNTAVNWNSFPLYLSLQIGNNAACTNSNNDFKTNCSGDSEMNPYILLTSTPYAMNSNRLNGFGSSAFGQLANAQTWANTNTFQPSTNVSSLIVQQNSSGSFGQDVFDVQGSSGGTNNFIQVTSIAANAGAVTVQSLGSNALGLQSGGAINIDTNNVANTVQIGNTANAVAQTIDIGNNATASSTDTIAVGSTVGSSTTTVQGGTGGSSAITLTTGAGGGTTVASAQPASSSGSGTNASTVLTVTGANGGNTSGTSGQTAGKGGGVLLQGGNGGTASTGSTNGNGGAITLSAGAAGSGTGTAGSAGSVLVKNQGDSTAEFQVQTAGGSSLLAVDGVNNLVSIGNGSTGDTVGVLLVLDSKTNAGDPTEVNGAMYYNSNSSTFRCGINGSWTNCVNGQASTLDEIGGTGTQALTGSNINVDPIYIPGPMTINDFYVDVTTAVAGSGDV